MTENSRKNKAATDPVFIIEEIGINHNGDIDIAKKLIDAAVFAGCDAVKFQKRTPDICVPEDQKQIMRDTPWGRMSYIDYRHHMEFEREEFDIIDTYCAERNIEWFVSVWDTQSIEFVESSGILSNSGSIVLLNLKNTSV